MSSTDQKVVECCVDLPEVLHGVVMATEVGRDSVFEQEGAESVHKFRSGSMLPNGPNWRKERKSRGEGVGRERGMGGRGGWEGEGGGRERGLGGRGGREGEGDGRERGLGGRGGREGEGIGRERGAGGRGDWEGGGWEGEGIGRERGWEGEGAGR